MTLLRVFPVLAILPSWILGQSETQNQIVSFGSAAYANPPHVAPGEILTLVSTALNVPDSSASTIPLPRSLSGVSVLARVIGATDTSGYPTSLPIFRIYNESALQMPNGIPCSNFPNSVLCSNTQITVEIPTEGVCAPSPVPPPLMPKTCNGPPYSDFPPMLVLNISANGITGPDLTLQVVFAAARPLNSCDSVLGPQASSSCSSLITHVDGTLVTSASPARAGESITLYAVGIGFNGLAAGGPPTGTAPDRPEELFPSNGYVTFTFGNFVPADGSAVAGVYTSTAVTVPPDWIGLIPGYVGLYQINVTVPPAAQSPRACGSAGNVQITLAAASTGTLSICVQP